MQRKPGSAVMEFITFILLLQTGEMVTGKGKMGRVVVFVFVFFNSGNQMKIITETEIPPRAVNVLCNPVTVEHHHFFEILCS